MSDLSQAKAVSLQSRVSPEEWAMRVDIAACYRLVALFGMNGHFPWRRDAVTVADIVIGVPHAWGPLGLDPLIVAATSPE